MKERELGVLYAADGAKRGRPRTEDKDPRFAAHLRGIVEPKTQADPELKSTRQYTNMTAAEVRQALIEQKGYSEEQLPSERTFRTILNRMNYRLKRIQKSQAPEEDRGDGCDLREHSSGSRGGAFGSRNPGNLHRYESESRVGRVFAWGKKAGVTRRVKCPKV